jgi:hypothetical protein
MTPTQHLEVKRMTGLMWAILRRAKNAPVDDDWFLTPTWLRAANILARRGFIEIQPRPGRYYAIGLTAEGREALTAANFRA